MTPMTQVWIVGDYNDGQWELIGIVVDEAAAIAACKAAHHFIAPVELGAFVYEPAVEFPGTRYPLLEGAADVKPEEIPY